MSKDQITKMDEEAGVVWVNDKGEALSGIKDHIDMSDDLARIREVLKPAVSDLASTLGVSRQSVYNWINGETIADGNAAKLQDLAEAADLLALEGVTVNAALLKRKFSNGRTLMQVAQSGGSAKEASRQLAHIHKQETAQYKRMESRFANRARTAPSADFDLPSANDYV